jgi:Amt family ammonium transporter
MAFDPGAIAWVAICTALVMLMTPALGFFYGGLVKRKNLVSTIIQCFAVYAVVALIWTLWGYSLAFGPTTNGIIGDLSLAGMWNVGINTPTPYASGIPMLLHFAFQLQFAAITPALIIGAFAERIRFRSLLIYAALWSTLVYCPIACWLWNSGGWLHQLGAIDFAGGMVVHANAGLSALAAALAVGRRKGVDRGATAARPNNVPYVILGAALLWFGWFGFNAGSALAANSVAVSAFVDTNLAAAAAGLSWMFVEWLASRKPTSVGFAVGAVCGLAAITPAAGYVNLTSAIIIGLVAGIVSNLIARWRSGRTRIDDSLDVFAAHGGGGIWGSLATGIFAMAAINGASGLLFGNAGQLFAQVIAVVAVSVYSFVGSFVLLKVIGVFSPLRVSEKEERKGLDSSQLGEEAYSDNP